MDLINKGIQTTDGKCYLITEDTFERLEIQFVPPELENGRRANINPTTIVGRNIPKYQNTGGEERLRFTLDFYADEESRSSVLMKVRWLKNLCYNNGTKAPAQRIQVIFGEMFKKELWIMDSVEAKFTGFNKPNGFLPQQATVELTMFLDLDYNPTWEDMNYEFTPGTPDGQNPINLGTARSSDDKSDSTAYTNNNTFAEMMSRLGERLRFGKYGGYDYSNSRF